MSSLDDATDSVTEDFRLRQYCFISFQSRNRAGWKGTILLHTKF